MGAFILKANAIVKEIEDHALMFATPVPDLAVVKISIGKLTTAQAKVRSRVKGASSERDIIYNIVLNNMRGLRSYVQGRADAVLPDVASAKNIILESGFQLKGRNVYQKPPLKAKHGAVTGTVALAAKAVDGRIRATYQWQQSVDGVTWTILQVTTMAKATIGPLSMGQYYFRYSSVTSKSKSEWSAPVTIFVFG